MLIDADYTCAYCGEIISTSVDISAGRRQSYIEDCQVCCRPNILHIEVDSEGEVQIDAEAEMDMS